VRRDIFLIIKLLLITCMAICVATLILCLYNHAFADTMYVLCGPTTEINVRISPRKNSEVLGYRTCGDSVETDGIERNGYLHIINLNLELAEGWIYKGLLVNDPVFISEGLCQINSSGRVASRVYINGKRRKWLKDGTEVMVYAIGREWSYTNKGYIRTDYLTLNYPQIPQPDYGD